MTAPSIALAAILIVAAGLVEVVRVHGPENIAHQPIPKDLTRYGGRNICGRGRRGGRRRGPQFCRFHPTYVG